MHVEIKNLTHRPVLMRLNSGTSVHLSPGATSAKIADGELSNNEKVQKLLDRHIIAVEEAQKRAPKTSAPKSAGKPAKRKKK